MFELARYEIERRLRGAVILSVLLAAYAAMMLAFYPSIKDSSANLEEYIDQLPDFFKEAFGITDFSSVGGFLSAELYQFVWLLLLGTYLAYRAASLVAADVETHRIDLLLATPISRTRLLYERFAALVPAMVLVNVVTPPVILVGLVVLGEPLSLARLLAVHALSIPYFLACASAGLLMSVLVDRESLASRAAIGLIFGLFLVETLAATAGQGWIGAISPTRYYDPTALLVSGRYDPGGALVLLAGAAGLLLLAGALFRRADIE